MVATALFIAVAPALLLSPRAPCPRVPSVAMQSPDAPPKLDFMKLLDGESTEDKPKASGGAKVTIKKREPKPKPKVEEESAAPAAATDDATTTVVTPPEPTAAAEEKEEEDDGVKVKISAPAPGASSVTVKKPSDTPKPPLFDAGELLQGHEALAQMVEGCEEACDPALLMTSLASTWDDIDGEKTSALRTWLNKLEGDFGKGEQEPTAIKEQLVGTWKLLLTASGDKLLTSGLSGAAKGPKYGRVASHFQTFKKPDPMAIFGEGGPDAKLFMETTEVSVDTVEGKSDTTSVKGGFSVGRLSGGDLDVVEYYSVKVSSGLGGVDVREEVDTIKPNSWSCTYVSPSLRVCKLLDGTKRVYAKVDGDEALEEIKRLGGLKVNKDPMAAMAYKAELAAKAKKAAPSDDEDDPNDDRPLWQKRIDKADGVKRTKNGTPIRTDNFS